MGRLKLKAGLKGLKGNEVYEKLVDEFESTFKEMKEIYDLVVEYPFAEDIKERLLLLNQKFKTLKGLLKELKQEKKQLILFKDRLRKRLNEMSEKVRRIASLVSLHQFILEKDDELSKRAEELKKILQEYQTTDISELENELLAHDLELSEEEKKLDSINKELNIIVELFDKEFEKLTEQISKDENEIFLLKEFIEEHDKEIKELMEKYSVIELLKNDLKELINTKKSIIAKGSKAQKGKKDRKLKTQKEKTTQKQVKNKDDSKAVEKIEKKETNKLSGKKLSKKALKTEQKKKSQKNTKSSRASRKKIDPKLKKLLKLKEKYEAIVRQTLDENMKRFYSERLSKVITQIQELEFKSNS